MIWFALVLGLFNLATLVAFTAAGYWAWLKAKPIVVPMLAMLGPPPPPSSRPLEHVEADIDDEGHDLWLNR